MLPTLIRDGGSTRPLTITVWTISRRSGRTDDTRGPSARSPATPEPASTTAEQTAIHTHVLRLLTAEP